LPRPALGQDATHLTGEEVILATTTSTADTGLLDALAPLFLEKTGISLKPIAVGSGMALELGERGEADVLLVHSPEAEEEFMAAGYDIKRRTVMVNDFVLVSPADDDPAGVAGASSASEAMTRIANAKAAFVSRGNDSGTHALERRLWKSHRGVRGCTEFDCLSTVLPGCVVAWHRNDSAGADSLHQWRAWRLRTIALRSIAANPDALWTDTRPRGDGYRHAPRRRRPCLRARRRFPPRGGTSCRGESAR
jgi:hypothetical protein